MPPLPVDTVGLIGLLIVTVGGWVTAWITNRSHRSEVRSIKGDVGEVKEQVQNSHQTNLRDDLDEMKTAVNTVVLSVAGVSAQLGELHRYSSSQGRDISGIREDLGALRGELRTERADRTSFERAVRAAYRANHPDGDPL